MIKKRFLRCVCKDRKISFRQFRGTEMDAKLHLTCTYSYTYIHKYTYTIHHQEPYVQPSPYIHQKIYAYVKNLTVLYVHIHICIKIFKYNIPHQELYILQSQYINWKI
jgi:hypothetical protein